MINAYSVAGLMSSTSQHKRTVATQVLWVPARTITRPFWWPHPWSFHSTSMRTHDIEPRSGPDSHRRLHSSVDRSSWTSVRTICMQHIKASVRCRPRPSVAFANGGILLRPATSAATAGWPAPHI
jgi:hypothetical protein